MTDGEVGDRLEILELLGKYSRGADNGPAEDVVATYTDDGVFEGGIAGRIEGKDALLAYYHQVLTAPDWARYRGGQHLIGGTVIEFHGESADAWSSFIFVIPGAPPSVAACGEYSDHLKKVDGRWRFASRKTRARVAGSS